MFIETLLHPVIQSAAIDLKVLRLDRIDTLTGGNKLFKLKYNLIQAREQGCETLLTFGGAYSNHIAATAAQGREKGFKTIGIIRGDYTTALNKTLSRAKEQGMELHFVSREQYKTKNTDSFLKNLSIRHPKAYIIPEGGNNENGFLGCKEILGALNFDFDVIVCAVGTGTTLAGITASLKHHQQALGIAVLRGESMLIRNIQQYLNTAEGFTLNCDYTFGGYAKCPPLLTNFVADFAQVSGIAIEPVYTGKMFFGVMDLVQKGFFQKGTKIVCIHTGGLQYL